MVEYGVVVTNKFGFLSDDEGSDPDEILEKAAQIKKVKGTVTKQPSAVVPSNNVKPERVHNKENEGAVRGRNNRGRGKGREGGERREGERHEGGKPREGGERRRDGERGNRGRGAPRGDRRPPRSDRQDVAPVEGEERVDGERERSFRGGRGGFRGPRRGGHRGDRVSGSEVTGVRPHDKRQGHGKGNWGTEQDEIKGETEPVTDVDGTKPNENGENVEEPEKEKEEEKPMGITLLEWKKLHEQSDQPSFNVRKPNIDKKLNLVAIKRDDEQQKETEEYVTIHREPKQKKVDIAVNFNTGRAFGRNDRSDRGDRGDRGERGDRRGRGGYNPGRGGQKGGRNANQGFSLTNEAFPAL